MEFYELEVVDDSPKPESSSVAESAKQASFVNNGQYLYEEILTGSKPSFLRYDHKADDLASFGEAEKNGSRFLPISGEEIDLGAIILPNCASEYGDTRQLITRIDQHTKKYLDVSERFRKFAVYYILLSWLYDRLNTLPYLRALGDTGCGKSRFLDVVGRLCYKATIVSGCITPAPIYRMIKRWGGTIILDEADLKNSDEYHEVVTILNCGFERGRPVIRATKENPDKLQFLPTFGPKVFATRRRFQDPALEARCLTEIMQETAREDMPPLLGARFYEEQQELRNQLLLFRLRNWHKIDPEQAAALDLGDIEPRLKQISSAFGPVFLNLDEVLEDFEVFIREHQRELIEQRAATPTGQILEILFSIIESGTSGTIVPLGTTTGEKLLEITPKDISNKLDVTPQAVGQILKSLGLKTKQKKIAGEKKRFTIYEEQKLTTLRRRYIVEDEPAGTDVPDGTDSTGSQCQAVVNSASTEAPMP